MSGGRELPGGGGGGGGTAGIGIGAGAGAGAEAEAEVDIAIVGAGIAGASLAWQLLQPDQDGGRAPVADGASAASAAPSAPGGPVLLLEREAQPGLHSTGRSAAMYMASYGPPQVRALTRASGPFYRQPPAGLLAPGVALLTPRAALYVAQPGQAALLDALAATLAPHCPGLRRLDRAEALALVPCLRPDQVLAALLDPEGADIDVHALHQGFLRGARQAGAMLWCGAELVAAERLLDLLPMRAHTPPASGAQAHIGTPHIGTPHVSSPHIGQPHPIPPRWRLHLADGRRVRARTVVNAAGAWADQVGALLGAAPIGLVPRRRSAFTFNPPEGLPVRHWPAVVAVDESWYFKPDAGRLLGSPANADATTPHDVLPEALDIALGIDRIETATTLQIRRPASTWAGLRSFVADGEPVIGWDPRQPGLFWLAGQGGYGIQSAHGAALLAASLLRQAPLPDVLRAQGLDPAALSPQRLGAAPPTRG